MSCRHDALPGYVKRHPWRVKRVINKTTGFVTPDGDNVGAGVMSIAATEVTHKIQTYALFSKVGTLYTL